MILKRAVDKYNLVFVYDTEIADKSVHRLAGNFIIFASIIQQLALLFFVLVRSGLSIENENFIFQKFRISFFRNITLFINDCYRHSLNSTFCSILSYSSSLLKPSMHVIIYTYMYSFLISLVHM
jgi:hypothetical protein